MCVSQLDEYEDDMEGQEEGDGKQHLATVALIRPTSRSGDAYKKDVARSRRTETLKKFLEAAIIKWQYDWTGGSLIMADESMTGWRGRGGGLCLRTYHASIALQPWCSVFKRCVTPFLAPF